MPINKKYLADFEEDGVYHVYNKTNNKELLFLKDEHRFFFLKRYAAILSPFINTYCWCLLPNHFHLMVKVKSVGDITNHLKKSDTQLLTATEKKFLDNKLPLGILIERQFTRFFQSYSQSFNKEQNRSGNLFYKPFKRILINSEPHFTQTIIYIHANALKHGIVSDFTKYKWSSWKTILSNGPTTLQRKEILDWFGGKQAFINAHFNQAKYYYGGESNDLEE